MAENQKKRFKKLNIDPDLIAKKDEGKFQHQTINVDEDEDSREALAKIAEIEKRNAQIERIELEREKVVGADVTTKIEDGIRVRSYKVAQGADTIFNVQTQGEIERQISRGARSEAGAGVGSGGEAGAGAKVGTDAESDAGKGAGAKVGADADGEENGFREVSAAEEAANLRIDPEDVAQRLAAMVKDDRIICIGDSITYGYEVDGSLTWIGRLRREEEINLFNVGLNGDTTAGMLGRFKEHVLDLEPKAVMIMGGGNDILGGTPLEYVTNNVVMMVQMAMNKGIVPIIGISPEPSPKDVPKEWHQMMDYDEVRKQMAVYKEWLIAFADANKLPYIDFDTAMKNRLRSGYGRYFMDGVHPNPAGHKLLAGIAKKEFIKMGLLPKPEEDDRFAL